MSILQVYVRPAGSYVMDQLELRQVANFPGIDVPEISECIVLVANFAIPAGLRAAEAALLKQQVWCSSKLTFATDNKDTYLMF